MSSPAGQAASGQAATGQAAPGQATTVPAAGQATTPGAQSANQPGAQGSGQPAATPAAAPETQRSSTPQLLRVARALATAAALLTGVVATGTFDTNGLNSTPNVIASQWEAAEEARVETAQADLLAAQGVTEAVAGEEPTVDLEPALTAAADAHARAGGPSAQAGETAADLVRSGLLASAALDAAEADAGAAVELYGTASTLAQDATATAEGVAQQHATDLRTGSRSALTAAVGMVSTALLAAVLVWLALRTRRIVNVPLLVATAITGWLTYVSMNPGALPLDIDQRVDEATTAATALQEVREARQSEYATVLGIEDVDLGEAADQAAAAVGDAAALRDAGLSGLPDTWEQVLAGHEAVAGADGAAAGLEVIRATETAYTEVEQQLQELLDDRLQAGTVGTPAAITSGVALLLGLIAAAAAWSGLTRRLKDYR